LPHVLLFALGIIYILNIFAKNCNLLLPVTICIEIHAKRLGDDVVMIFMKE